MILCGIDLGTTNSLITAYTESGPVIVPNGLGQPLTPSAISVLDDDTVLVGSAAKDRMITHPQASAASFKRLMGSSRETRLNRISLRPEELSAFVLRSLKEDAERYFGEAVEEVIISVPAYFSDIQRKATIDAGRLAGLRVKRLVNEPTAAALAYGLNEVDEAKFLIFDLGGGTFDVSILDKFEGILEVRATTGDSRLGGDDFTLVVENLIHEFGKIDDAGLSAVDQAKIRAAAEAIKYELSRRHESSYPLALSDREITIAITRSQFEEAASPLLSRLREPIERAISDAQMRPEEIHSVVMVGGATRMPMVRSLVARLFGRMPLIHLDPDTIVARGASIQAALASRNEALDDVVMTDVCPFTLGVASLRGSAKDELFVVPIIDRNAMVPISRNRQFCTTSDGQKEMHIPVYQGEHMRPEDNILIGELILKVPQNKAGMESIDVRFTYDVSGALQVEGTVISTGEKKSTIFRNNSGLSDQEIEERFKSMSEIKLHPREQLPNKALLARAERLYTQHVGENREIIGTMTLQFELEISSQHNHDLEASRQRFSQALNRFELSVFGD